MRCEKYGETKNIYKLNKKWKKNELCTKCQYFVNINQYGKIKI